MEKNKLLQSLSLCRRAGQLQMGFDSVKESVEKGKASLIVVSAGLSKKTYKEALFLKERYHLPLIQTEATMDELWYLLGKRVGIMTVTDPCLGEKIHSDALEARTNWEENYDTKKI